MDRRALRIAQAAALCACAALLAAPWRGHVDDMDAQLYLVLARNLARDGAWLDLRFLPGFLPHFRDHLPFGIWPAAAAIRLSGEWAVNPIYALFTLGTIAVAGRIAQRIAGPWAGVAAMLALGTCESIWQYGGRPLLEPPLLLFATAAAGAALAEKWAPAAVLGGIATLIKGPFGLLPLACVAGSRLPQKRAIAAVFCAAIPVALFLWADLDGTWRGGYLRGQLLASASGTRLDSGNPWWMPLWVIAGRFWPGLPLALLGAWQARRDPKLRPLAIACGLMAALLCLPQRKWGNHAYVTFPLLAALAGAAAAPLLEKVRPRLLAGIAAAAAAAAVLVSISGLGARVLRPPCAFSTALREPLDALAKGAPILIVSPQPDLAAIAQLAAERDLVPWPESALPEAGSIHEALAPEGTQVPASWVVTARGGGWVLLRAR